MKKIIVSLISVVLVFGLIGAVSGEVNSVTPSTNDINRTNGWAHVNEISVGVGEVTLDFVQPRSFYSCFEYRTDGDVSQVIDEEHFLEYYGVVPQGDLQQYPYLCLSTISNKTKTIPANEYVEIRMMFGAEGDERFDWTRFDVIPALTTPEIIGFFNPSLPCGVITNIHSTTVDWTDSIGGVGGIVGYHYAINYPLADGSGQGNWSTFVTSSQYSGSLNEGVHTIKVRAKDSVGNYSDWSNECTITADWTAPDAVITNPGDASIVSGVVDVRGSVIDANPHHYWLVIVNSSGSKVAGPGTVNKTESFTNMHFLDWNTTLVPDGDYTIKLEARDAANNKDSGSIDWHDVIVKNIPDAIGPPIDKNECKKGGWKLFDNPTFKNQGDCISWLQSSENAKGNRKNN